MTFAQPAWLRLLTALVAPVLGASVVAAHAAAPRPNIVLVMTDDQGYGDLACHGNPHLRTPHLDRLHRESTRLVDFHVSPTCSPTRSALLTGRHEFFNGVTHTIAERERLTLDAVTLPEVLRAAGYRTGIFGKWHLGDEDQRQPGRRGFDEVFVHGAGGIGQTFPGSCGDAPGNRYFDPLVRRNGVFEKTAGYCTDVFFDAALRWIEGVKDRGPFFCYLTPNAPHEPLDCPPGSDAPYRERVPANVARFYGMIGNLDANVGRLVERLDRWGIQRQTLLIFLTDNGSGTGAGVFNAGMRGAKGTPWEGGTRVPSFWRWPGTLAAARDVTQLTCHWDLLPTLAEWAGAPLDDRLRKQVRGRSLAPLLTGASQDWPERTFVTHVGRWPRGQARQAKTSQCAIRDSRWSLVSPRNGPWELYDLQSDRAQQRNLAERRPEVVARLSAEFDRWWEEVLPRLGNEDAVGPAVNPYKAAYWQQYQGPGPNNVPPPSKLQ